MSIRSLIALAAVAAALGACAPTMGTGPTRYAPPAAFIPAEFAWSAVPGNAAIEGRVSFTRDGQSFACTGSVALTPETPYSRQRFQSMYGSTERAAIPEAVVRARTDTANPNAAAYRAFVRSETCQNGRFRFDGLPAGSWFLITPVSAGAERIVLMRRVVTRANTTANVTL